MEGNVLYYGDNLDILREYIPDDSVDLVYLDPPFSSDRNYNVLFREENGTASAAQVHAFEDTWHWNQASEDTLTDMMRNAPSNLVGLMNGLLSFLGRNQFTAYLVMMAPRLLELHRVLKSTGSLYLHCDPTASHYLKIILDQIFGTENFRNEIVWHYRRWTGKAKKFQTLHDILFFYTKTDNYNFNVLYTDYTKKSLKRKQHYHTRIKDGDVYETSIDKRGVRDNDVWHIQILNSQAKERLGYPTQKPEALLERIIKASSNEGDIILDPFCGCGTTIAVAERVHRRWIGIDITHLAITLMRSRLEDTFSDTVDYEIVGEPLDISGASALAKQDRYQFEWWALSLVRARPVDQKKKGADKGIDGVKFINTTPSSRKATMVKMVVQVKSGHVGVKDIREFRTVVDNAKAQMGAFITLENPTGPMVKEALTAGHYTPTSMATVAAKYPKVQILTIGELLNGKTLQIPLHEDMTYRRARKTEAEQGKQPELFKG